MPRQHLRLTAKIIYIITLHCLLNGGPAYAQRIGIKPLIGFADNGTNHFETASPSFAKSSFSAPRPFVGFVISYSFLKVWQLEVGMQRRPLSVSADLLNPYTKEVIGTSWQTERLGYYQLNITKTIVEISPKFSLKAIAGFELLRTGRGYGGNSNIFRPDTLILPNYMPGQLSPLSFNPGKYWASGIMLGIGTEWKAKQKTIAELRLCLAYQMQPLHGLRYSAKVNGIQQEEQFKATQLNYNVTLLFNLLTILGTKWKN